MSCVLFELLVVVLVVGGGGGDDDDDAFVVEWFVLSDVNKPVQNMQLI